MADKTTPLIKGDQDATIKRTLLETVTDTRILSDGVWVGINIESGDSGDVVAWRTDGAIYNFYVPDGLAVSDGDTVWVDPTDRTGNNVDDTAYGTSDGGSDIALFKALADKDTSGGSGNHFVRGRSLLHLQGVS